MITDHWYLWHVNHKTEYPTKKSCSASSPETMFVRLIIITSCHCWPADIKLDDKSIAVAFMLVLAITVFTRNSTWNIRVAVIRSRDTRVSRWLLVTWATSSNLKFPVGNRIWERNECKSVSCQWTITERGTFDRLVDFPDNWQWCCNNLINYYTAMNHSYLLSGDHSCGSSRQAYNVTTILSNFLLL